MHDLRKADPFVDEVCLQLERVCASSQFDRATKLQNFLRFVVVKKLLGHEDQIKEMTIAMAVWKEDFTFNPTEDNKVRVAAGVLRQKLIEYAMSESLNDPIQIMLHPGSYVPELRERHPKVGVALFHNWNLNGADEHLRVLIRDEIADRLNHSGGVRVERVERLDPQSCQLRYGLHGSLESRNGHLRLNTSLIEIGTGRNLSSDVFEDRRENVLGLSERIARATREALKAEIADVAQPHGRERPERFDALQLYQRGRAHFGRRTATDIRTAIDLFQQATEANEEYARAYSGLADCHLVMSWFDLGPADRAWFETAKLHALRAMELNPRLPESHTSLAYAKLLCDFDWDAAEAEFERALRHQNRYALAHHWLANLLIMQGRFSEAVEALRRASHLDGSIVVRKAVGDPFYYSGDYDRAIESYQAALKIAPHFWMPNLFLGWTYQQIGQPEKAFQAFQNIPASAGISSVLQGAFGHLYATTGREREALALIEDLKKQPGAPYIAPHTLAVIYAGLGDKDQAFAWLDVSLEQRTGLLAWIQVDPRFKSLHGDPRFARFLNRIGLHA